ncbi:winged helix-turn-helix domain-containing protein [Ornithinimicrobium pratense]|uniref:winged helix-turn-helix domain-containing protein n=1 Tax=Ornithinimicrobium pratense TaxID=2593973 RepID=UPI00178780AE|nr:winged helix-turn-helix domain-containing protein [Ornithinimicrobium pratense]
MTRPAWLIPLEAAPAAFKTTLGALKDCSIPYIIVGPELVREQLDQDTPLASIVHGGAITPQLIDVQRWLAEFHVPTLVLVEALTDHYEASLLDRGARDVVGIPASTRKLRSRLDALVRSERIEPVRSSLPDLISVAGTIDIHLRQRTVDVGTRRVSLTKSEFQILLALALSQGDVVPRSELSVATGKANLSNRALESHISRTRMKLRAAGAPDCIDSVRSIGYRLQAIQ